MTFVTPRYELQLTSQPFTCPRQQIQCLNRKRFSLLDLLVPNSNGKMGSGFFLDYVRTLPVQHSLTRNACCQRDFYRPRKVAYGYSGLSYIHLEGCSADRAKQPFNDRNGMSCRLGGSC